MTTQHDVRPAGRGGMRAQAAAWFARLRADDAGEADRMAFQRWLDQDPAHRAAYARLDATWAGLEGYARAPGVRAARREALASQAATDASRPRVNGWRLARAAVPIAASLAVVLVGALFMLVAGSGEASYRTAVGERRTVELSDGSTVKLNTDSALTVTFSGDARRVSLDRGQAYFEVAADAARPFTVAAGAGSVTALGTAFDVLRTDTEVVVTLIEGRVRVAREAPVREPSTTAPRATEPLAAPLELVMAAEPEEPAGRQVNIRLGGLSDVTLASIEQTVAWQEGKLIFDDRPLAEALAEVNRYAARKVVLGDTSLEHIRISGVFRVGRSQTVVRALEAYYPIRATRDAAGNTVLMPAASS